MKRLWTIWKYAIGSFSDEQTAEYDDVVAIARTFIVGINVICAFFIIANIIVGWVR
tara:strand:- start:1492 stop:1659 length:168 start_codon:yes stop_codon:yes gene_type:complete